MNWLPTESSRAILLVGAILLYVASRVGADSLARGDESAGKRTVGHWIPIAAAALAALAMRRGDMALSIVFATSVASLSLVAGSLLLLSPRSEAPATSRRMWLFAFPAALLVLLAGFSGQLKWYHALILLAEGGMVLAAWRELNASAPVPALPLNDPSGRPLPVRLHYINLSLCIALGVIGALAAVDGAAKMSASLPQISPSVTVVAVVAPLLVLPMLVAAPALTHRNRAWLGNTTSVGVVLLNLCLLLPLLILLWYPVSAVHFNPAWHVYMDPLNGVTPLAFSWVTWRVDNVLLVVLAFVLVPPALDRWRLGWTEGITLVGLYVVYVLMETAASMRS